jgi:transposase
MSKKTSYDNIFKGKVALDAVKGEKTLNEIAVEYNVSMSLVSKWKRELLSNVGKAFGVGNSNKQQNSNAGSANEEKLYKQIGKLTMEVDFLKKFVDKYR